MLIENDKRGPEWSMPLTYSESLERQFYIPENLFILGMMNTADRSLSMVDYALRRRFGFISLVSQISSKSFSAHLKDHNVPEHLIKTINSNMIELNEEISSDTINLGPGFTIGHSFFCPNGGTIPNEMWYRGIIKNEIIPLLQEYWFDDTQNKVINWEKKLLRDI